MFLETKRALPKSEVDAQLRNSHAPCHRPRILRSFPHCTFRMRRPVKKTLNARMAFDFVLAQLTFNHIGEHERGHSIQVDPPITMKKYEEAKRSIVSEAHGHQVREILFVQGICYWFSPLSSACTEKPRLILTLSGTDIR